MDLNPSKVKFNKKEWTRTEIPKDFAKKKLNSTLKTALIVFSIVFLMSISPHIFKWYAIDKANYDGLYYLPSKQIILNEDNNEFTAIGAYLHERGHYNWHEVLTEEERDEYTKLYNKDKECVLDTENSNEDFSNAYKFYSLGELYDFCPEKAIFINNIDIISYGWVKVYFPS